ncbi:MAG: hypothetical protein HW389_3513 [Bacteroidetes bacterium]|nr:hypothetical protein [Bacteroidota bacterium]MBM2846485.1 hypothetical protein [Bacteroidota bacterium]
MNDKGAIPFGTAPSCFQASGACFRSLSSDGSLDRVAKGVIQVFVLQPL